VLVYADRGRIYLAERSSDPSLGARLVDAGTLNATQLEHGAMRIGDAEHLGRLFERVPSIDRQKVLVTAELMTEACIGWLASQRISHIVATPYRHHPSGAHRWDQPFAPLDLTPGDPLPAPAPGAAPVAIAPPEPLFRSVDDLGDVDDMIRWNEPSWLDEQVTPLTPIDVAGRFAALRAAAAEDEHEPITLDLQLVDAAPVGDGEAHSSAPSGDESVAAAEHQKPDQNVSADWIEQLSTAGLPEPGSDPLASPVKLPPVATEPTDHFELIWPSGDIDEQFGAQVAEPHPHPDIDRAGVTARLVGRHARHEQEPAREPAESMAPSNDTLESWLGDENGREAITDEVVLAVRRAVASIDTGSLAARRRLVDVPAGAPAAMSVSDGPVAMPGRVAVRTDSPEVVSQAARGHVNGLSVFDNLPPIEPSSSSGGGPVDRSEGDDEAGEPQRASALRRLIGSLRRR